MSLPNARERKLPFFVAMPTGPTVNVTKSHCILAAMWYYARMKTTKRFLDVAGILWGGGEGETSYPLTNDQQPTTREQVKAIAGDFCDVTSAVISKVTTETVVETQKVL